MIKDIFNTVLEVAKHIGWMPTILFLLNGFQAFAMWKMWQKLQDKDRDCHKAEIENLRVFAQMNQILENNIQKSGHDQEIIKNKLDNLKDLIITTRG